MAFDTALSQYAFLAGRLAYGGILALMALNHFRDTDDLAGYAKMNGVPEPRLMVLLSGAVLLTGSVSIMTGLYPSFGSLLILAFLVPVTLEMHGFWSVDDPDRKQQEMTRFLKNTGLAGGALVLLALAGADWPHVLTLGM